MDRRTDEHTCQQTGKQKPETSLSTKELPSPQHVTIDVRTENHLAIASRRLGSRKLLET